MCQDVSLMFCSFVVQFEKSRCRIALRLFQALSDGVIFFLSFFLSFSEGAGAGRVVWQRKVERNCELNVHNDIAQRLRLYGQLL